MRHFETAGAAVLLTASLAGCTSVPVPEQALPSSASPEVTPTPTPTPEETLGMLACSDALSVQSLIFPEREALEVYTEEYSELTQDELQSFAIDGIATLNTVSIIADGAVEPGIVDGPNPDQNGYGFVYELNQDTGDVVIEDWNFSNGEECIVSSVSRKFIGNQDTSEALAESIEIALGNKKYQFIIDGSQNSVNLVNSEALTAEAVATMQVLGSRYNGIISDLQKLGQPFFPEPDSLELQPDVIFPSEV